MLTMLRQVHYPPNTNTTCVVQANIKYANDLSRAPLGAFVGPALPRRQPAARAACLQQPVAQQAQVLGAGGREWRAIQRIRRRAAVWRRQQRRQPRLLVRRQRLERALRNFDLCLLLNF